MPSLHDGGLADRRGLEIPTSTHLGKLIPVFCSDGTLLSVNVYPNASARARILVSHGNGFAVHGYRKFWDPLRDEFEVITLDMRGHGASESGDAALHHWDQFAVDLHSVLGAIGANDDRPLIGAFHSLSAITSLLHLNRFQRTQPWQSLILFDPPLAGPKGHPIASLHDQEMKALSDTALRRRRVYASVEERERQFKRTDVFGVWETGAPLDMAHATLRPDRFADAWLLSCDPEREAFVFRTGTQTEVWDVLARHTDIIKIIAGDPYRAGAESPAKVSLLAHELTGVAYAEIPGTGHFLQLEQPELCRRELINFVNR